MADPDPEDPVERMSTRVSAVSLAGTQATYDLRRWETDVFVDFGITLELAISVASQLVPTLQRFYGLDELSAEETLAALDEPDIVAYRAAADMLAMIGASDPPIRIIGRPGLPTGRTRSSTTPTTAVRSVRRRSPPGSMSSSACPGWRSSTRASPPSSTSRWTRSSRHHRPTGVVSRATRARGRRSAVRGSCFPVR